MMECPPSGARQRFRCAYDQLDGPGRWSQVWLVTACSRLTLCVNGPAILPRVCQDFNLARRSAYHHDRLGAQVEAGSSCRWNRDADKSDRHEKAGAVDLGYIGGSGSSRVAWRGEAGLSTLLSTQTGSMLHERSSFPQPGILLDRDGTIIVDHGYVGSVDRVEFIEGSLAAIAKFNRANIPVAVVTNQAGVARGLYQIDDVIQVHEHIAERLAEHRARIDLFLFCPYHPAGVVRAFARTSEDRKPRPGMARAAEIALNLDLTASWVVGDRPEDIGLAEAVGASAVYLGTDACERPGVWSFPSLAAAAPFILERIAV
jgi:histidinol-phosphate phosphatase family protein